MKALLFLGLAAFAPLLPASAAVISIPTGNVTSSSQLTQNPFNRRDDFLVNGSGLTGNQHGTAPDGNMWLSTGAAFGGVDPDPWVMFDLGATYTINSFHVWNYNEVNLSARSVNSVTVRYGADTGVSSSVAGITGFAQATGLATYTGQAFNGFTPFEARYIKFDINTNHGGDNSFYGLSEVRFDGVLVPEPSSLLLAALGLLGMMSRRR